MRDYRCTLYVSSCDSYSDLWEGFFFFLNKRWPDCPFPIVLVSESKTFGADGMDIRCPRLNRTDRKIPWGDLQLRALDTIDSPYILFMLEDFFISRGVDGDMIRQCLDWMDADSGIGKFMLRPARAERGVECGFTPFRQSLKLDWCVNAQAAIWRTDLFRRAITPHISVWDWENIASRYARGWPERFYIINEDWSDSAPIYYAGGGVVHNGMWIEEALQLLRRNGLNIDVNRRGVARGYRHKPPFIVDDIDGIVKMD
ncbi:MAG: hypothetical protein LBH66_07970 [Oscillospiraceae bacterium]|jgi:hypothetical protein|nr:hypothetical protein [Oscillospiraceae bacterium]